MISCLVVALIHSSLDFFVCCMPCCSLRFKLRLFMLSCCLVVVFAWLGLSLAFWWLINLVLGLTTPSLYLQIRVFSHTHHMFDETLKRVFIRIFGWLTYAKRWGQLASVGERITGIWA